MSALFIGDDCMYMNMNAPQGVFECVCGQFKVTTSYVPLLYGTAVQQRLTVIMPKPFFATELQSRITGTAMTAAHFVTELWEQWSRQVGLLSKGCRDLTR